MEELILSETTGKKYDPTQCVRIVNIKQVMFYMKNGIEILDFYPSQDFKTQEDIMVFLVDKLRTQMIYKKWMDMRDAKK